MNAILKFIQAIKKNAFFALVFSCFLTVQAVSQHNIGSIYPGIERFIDVNSVASADYLKDSTYTFHDEEGSWLLKSKSVYNHDVQGNEILMLESKYEDFSWMVQSKVEKAYDSVQNIIFQRKSKWSEKHAKWEFLERKDFEYNTVDLLEREINWLRKDELWKRDKKTEFSYFHNYNIESISESDWELESQEWIPTERTLFEYTTGDNLNREIIQIWNDSLKVWLNYTSREYNYDENNILISTTRSNWSSAEQGWVDISMVSLIYNDKGQIESTRQIGLSPSIEQNLVSQDVSYDDQGNLGETIISNWNSEDGEWESVTKRVHFWSESITGNLDSRTTDISCAFMNPYILGLSWKCNSLKANVLYTVEVKDLWGRNFFSDQFMGNRAFRIDGNIPPGVYIVVIRGGIDVHTEKVIIKG